MILWTFTRQVWFYCIVVIASCSFNPQTILAGCQELLDGGSDRVCSLNTHVLDTLLLSLLPAEVNNYMWLPTKTNLILLKVVAANDDEVSQRTREGLAQLHSSLHLAFCESNVIVARFHALVKLEKV